MRNINIDRDPISSEAVSSYKDFKSIQKKHNQTTNDLNKIKSGKSNMWYLARGGAIFSLVLVSSLFILNNGETKTEEEITSIKNISKVAVDNLIQEELKWQVVINKTNDPIHKYFDFNQVSSERVEYFQFGDSYSIKELIPSIKSSDIEYTKDKKVFKITTDFSLELKADKNLFQLVEGNWLKVDHKPFEFKTLIKPIKMDPGKPGIRIDVIGFGVEYQEFANMIWQPMNSEDLDATFFDHNWPDGSIVETNVSGVYKITLKDDTVVMHFNGYPVLQKYAYKKAMKEYNKKLIGQEDLMKISPKHFEVKKGIYTIE
jgi:hypothetical protein|tara:strand:- start:1215 stop:2162 length:948 start_codon:yes stop_codon:yes gene_type:complete